MCPDKGAMDKLPWVRRGLVQMHLGESEINFLLCLQQGFVEMRPDETAMGSSLEGLQ